MRMRTLQAISLLLLLTGLAVAQHGPLAPLRAASQNEVSASYSIVIKNTNMDLGHGTSFTASHFFTQHIGLTVEGGMTHVNRFNADESGIRFGGTYRLKPGSQFQPFVHALVGVSWVDGGFWPNRRSTSGGSFAGGGGVDVRVRGPLFLRLGADLVDDFGTSPEWRYGRTTIGFAYHFGDRGEVD